MVEVKKDINWKSVVETREGDLDNLRKRMDKDRWLRWGKDQDGNDFAMKNEQGKAIQHVHNVTLPDPKIFANSVLSRARSAEIQVNVVGNEIKQEEASQVEQLRKDFFTLADRELRYLGIIGGLQAANAGNSAIRGWLIRKLWPYVDKDNVFHTGVRAWDSRYCAWEWGINDYNWVSCRTTRSKAQIEKEYPEIGELRTKKADVLDIVTQDENIVYIADQEFTPKAGRLKNPLDRLPVEVVANANSDCLRDENYLEHEGESIFGDCRDIVPTMNELISILHTMTWRSFLGNLYLETANPGEIKLTTNPFGEREVVFLATGEKIGLIPINDIKVATKYEISMLEARWQRATLPAVDYGNLNFTLSAVAIKTLGEASDSKILPILATMAMMERSLTFLMLEWAKIMEFNHEDITMPDKSLLSKKFDVEVDVFSTSPVENMANYSFANEMSPFASREKVLVEALHDPNPHITMMEKYCDMAESLTQQSPPVLIKRVAEALMERGSDNDKEEAVMVMGLLGASVEALENPDMLANTVNPEKVPTNGQKPIQTGQGLPMFANAGQHKPGTKSSYEEAEELGANLGVE